jgi:hypothetical protein
MSALETKVLISLEMFTWPIPVAPPVINATLFFNEETSYFSVKSVLVLGSFGSRGPRCLRSVAILMLIGRDMIWLYEWTVKNGKRVVKGRKRIRRK